MNNRERHLKSISAYFANWQIQIANLNSLNLYDANIFSEYTLCELLNLIFDYHLVNANLIRPNFPAVDLVDEKNKIAFQVTSSKHALKVQNTIDVFFRKELYSKIDTLFILILGVKQKNYGTLKIPGKVSFVPDKQIFDFQYLLKLIARLPIRKIEKIASILKKESVDLNNASSNKNVPLIKKKLALKTRLQKDFLLDLDRKYWTQLRFEPWLKFTYHNVIIRSIDDKSFPGGEQIPGKLSGWLKLEFWNFYENGLEFITDGGEAIFDKDEYWDLLKWSDDKRENNQDYKKISCAKFLRIPYEYMVEYDMDTDPYYGLPTIYVEYAKNGMPYEEVLYGTGGYYNKESPGKSYYNVYFKEAKRKELK